MSEEAEGECLNEDEKDALDFLARTPRVDRRWLSQERITELTKVLGELHNDKKLSLLRISKLTRKSYMKVWGIYRALGIHARSLAEAAHFARRMRGVMRARSQPGEESRAREKKVRREPTSSSPCRAVSQRRPS